MPPRRSSRVAAAVERASTVLPPLPHALVLRIFALLPLDARCRATWVSRAWRAALLAERCLWATLDVQDVGLGVPLPALLRSAARLAGGDVTCIKLRGEVLPADDLFELAESCAASLTELHLSRSGAGRRDGMELHPFVLAELVRRAPALRALHADVEFGTFFGEYLGGAGEDGGCLRGTPPFNVLRVRRLSVRAIRIYADALAALFADCASHEALQELSLAGAALGRTRLLDALVDAAHARRLTRLRLSDCLLGAQSAHALARLLGAGGEALTRLTLRGDGPRSLDVAGGLEVGEALRSNATLTSLTLFGSWVTDNADACAALLRGAVGHASLSTLRFSKCNLPPFLGGRPSDAAAVTLGGALGAVVAADAASLTLLDISQARLGDAGLTPLVEALRINSHLRTLVMSDNDASAAFAVRALLPAVHANASLYFLCAAGGFSVSPAQLQAKPALEEAEATVYQHVAGGTLAQALEKMHGLIWSLRLVHMDDRSEA